MDTSINQASEPSGCLQEAVEKLETVRPHAFELSFSLMEERFK